MIIRELLKIQRSHSLKMRENLSNKFSETMYSETHMEPKVQGTCSDAHLSKSSTPQMKTNQLA